VIRIISAFLIAICPLVVGASCPVELSSVPTAQAKALAVSKLTDLLACRSSDPLNDQSPCNTFVGRGMETIYSVQDFKKGNNYLMANEIFDYATTNSRWVKIGGIYDENNNLCAQSLANNAYPVIAVLKREGNGHIALVIPGEPLQSPSWKFYVTNSASFFIGHPEKAYISAPLSAAFTVDNAKNAVFFYRKPAAGI
jgi:hypothetical protein